jgi:hypothetical protein
VVERYRGALVRLLGRGEQYIRTVEEPVLADLAFQAVLRLHEELEKTEVELEGELEPLVERRDLLGQKLGLLDAYLRERGGRDPNCLATARIQLGLCLAAREQWTAREWEILEAIAYRRGGDILVANEYASRAATDAGVDDVEMAAMIHPYAERAEWTGFWAEAERLLEEIEFGLDPFPWVTGSDIFSSVWESPAWMLAAYGAVAGFHQRQTYGLLVRNYAAGSSVNLHALVVEPGRLTVQEARRSPAGAWVRHHYRPIGDGELRAAGRMGAQALLDKRSPGLEGSVVDQLLASASVPITR